MVCGVAGWCPSGEDGRVRGRLCDVGRVSWSVDWGFLDLFEMGIVGLLGNRDCGVGERMPLSR